MIEVGLNLI